MSVDTKVSNYFEGIISLGDGGRLIDGDKVNGEPEEGSVRQVGGDVKQVTNPDGSRIFVKRNS